MKKSLISFLIITALISLNQINNVAIAQELSPGEMDSIETLLFNQTYTRSSIKERLDRIEKLVYGQSFGNEDIGNRMEKLRPFVPKTNVNSSPAQNSSGSQDLPDSQNYNQPASKQLQPLQPLNENSASSSSDNIPGLMSMTSPPKNSDYLDGTLPPRKQTVFTEDKTNNYRQNQQNNYHPDQNSYQNSQSPDDALDMLPGLNKKIGSSQQLDNDPSLYSGYPIVDEIEESLFNKKFTSENIYTRLERLEMQILGRTQKGSLYDRVTKIQKDAKYDALRRKFARQYTPVNPKPNVNLVQSSNQNNQYQQYNNLDSSNDFDDFDNFDNLDDFDDLNTRPSIDRYSSMQEMNTMSIGIQPPAPTSSSAPYANNTPPVSTNNYSSNSSFNTPHIGFKSDELAQLEQQLFGRVYEDDLSMERIDRIEKKVCGKTSFGGLNTRIQKVNDILAGKRPAKDVITSSYYAPPPYAYYGGYRPPYANPYNYVTPQNYPPNSVYNNYNSYNNNYQTQDPYAYQNQDPYGYQTQNPYGYQTQAPYSYQNPYGYNQYGYGMPVTPGNVAKAAAGAALQNTLSKKGGALGALGKVAGSFMSGGMMPYGNNNYYNPY
ncbi:MAG: hypothetical protein AB1782_08705 [Cyanobacteriota bacterium]